MCDCAEQIVGSSPIGKPFSMHQETQRITLRVILKVIFGVRRDVEHGPLARLVISLANVIASPLIFMPALQRDLGRLSPWGRIIHLNRQTDIGIMGRSNAAARPRWPNEWTPFGGGVRRCLGMALAHLEMKAVLATVLLSARLSVLNPHAKIKSRGFFLVPDGGPRVLLKEQMG